MCGIAGVISLARETIPALNRRLVLMNELQSHRGPDGEGVWEHPEKHLGFAHRRLSIIDLSTGSQPMSDQACNWLTYNGEIYNYIELREELGVENFITKSDTEVILHAYRKWGIYCVNHFRGMFAFSLWDESNQILFCARDRFGVKPFYYTIVGNTLYFASEIKALLPFIHNIETDLEGFKDYLTFQFCLAGKTLFKGIYELLPGHFLKVVNGAIEVKRYWEVYYELDFDHTAKYFEEKIAELLSESVELHLRSDV
ncbi:asparagine synthase (glutamine-hydrolyzing), partial [Mastigocoleus sp. MO_188.B34]|uniref:asparagine synthase (glutamine-hydrolyzing) n=1 Tax=Mastigocoleus sp. MO_188.B34 TaxID=3036635 RepID=UPI00261526CB